MLKTVKHHCTHTHTQTLDEKIKHLYAPNEKNTTKAPYPYFTFFPSLQTNKNNIRALIVFL